MNSQGIVGRISACAIRQSKQIAGFWFDIVAKCQTKREFRVALKDGGRAYPPYEN
jgi:hypothetical protein